MCVNCSATQQMRRRCWKYGMLLAVAASLLWPSAAPRTQEIEPRAYSAAPVSTNFLAVVYSHSMGGVLTDPSLPVTDIEARIDGAALGYVRTFGLFGRSASLGVVLPYAWANVSGEVGEQQREVSRAGLGDLRLRFSMNLLGSPALTREEFVTHTARHDARGQSECGCTCGAVRCVAPDQYRLEPLGVQAGSRRDAYHR